MPMRERATYVLELRPPAGDDRPELRMRRARCVSVQEVPSGDAERGAGDPGVTAKPFGVPGANSAV